MKPLQGLRILDLSSVIFGPLASQILADYGAEVIKIEPPEGDSTRHTGPSKEPGMAAMFLGSNRSKKSLALDLKQPAAQQALQALRAARDPLVALGAPPLDESNPGTGWDTLVSWATEALARVTDDLGRQRRPASPRRPQ